MYIYIYKYMCVQVQQCLFVGLPMWVNNHTPLYAVYHILLRAYSCIPVLKPILHVVGTNTGVGTNSGVEPMWTGFETNTGIETNTGDQTSTGVETNTWVETNTGVETNTSIETITGV